MKCDSCSKLHNLSTGNHLILLLVSWRDFFSAFEHFAKKIFSISTLSLSINKKVEWNNRYLQMPITVKAMLPFCSDQDRSNSESTTRQFFQRSYVHALSNFATARTESSPLRVSVQFHLQVSLKASNLLYSLYYTEAHNEFLGPIYASLRTGNTASFDEWERWWAVGDTEFD